MTQAQWQVTQKMRSFPKGMIYMSNPEPVEISFEKLEQMLLANNPKADVEFLRRAFEMSRKIHEGQLRDEGTPYFIHPYRVALYMAEVMKMDSEKILATALLHDTLEDNDEVTYGELEANFGPDVAACVNILTKPKVTQKRTQPMRDMIYHDRLMQAPRNVILVKIADRLDNIRYLHLVPDETKRRKYASETRKIFIPMAQKFFPKAAEEMKKILG
jgi:GTP diphosphokinase / guanosine-3',5'-bis(diphosphate) 3'-diphosphatase